MTEQADAAVESSEGPTQGSTHRGPIESDDTIPGADEEPTAVGSTPDQPEADEATPIRDEPGRDEPVSAEPVSDEPAPDEPVSAEPSDSDELSDSDESSDSEESDSEESDSEESDSEESEAPAEPEEPTYQRLDCTGESLANAAEVARAALERGECVVLPTDTVYGIGADAFDAEAVQRLLDAKQRGRNMPPAVLIADARLVKAFSSEVPQAATDLMAAHWPGALTVILPALNSLSVDLGETGGTIALRVPDHPLARELLRRTGPLAVSSANTTGEAAALSVDDAIAMLGNSVSVYLDGGVLGEPDTLASTMVDFTQSDHGQVLREGAISLETLRETVPEIKGSPRPRKVTTADDITASINAAADAPTPQPDSAVDSDPQIDPEIDPQADPEIDPQADPEIDPQADAEADAEVDPEVDPETDPGTDRDNSAEAQKREPAAPDA